MALTSLVPDILTDTLPAPIVFQKEIPISADQLKFIQSSRETIKAILSGKDSRKILIVGPCSIHDVHAAKEYAKKIRDLSLKVSDQFFLIMRAYFEKSRTILGWKGLLYDPFLDGSHHLEMGLRLSRKLLSEISDLGVPVGCELLEVNTSSYYSDFLSWGCIGARTSSSPPHRQLAASLDLPMGFKNSIDGNIDTAINGILSARTSHVYLGLSSDGKVSRITAEGNPHGHLVLRGGNEGPNYSAFDVHTTIKKCQKAGINERLLIDCSHDNCGKNYETQINVFKQVIEVSQEYPFVGGLMLESNLNEGRQPISGNLEYGVSITDPCLNWETTEWLILESYEFLNQKLYCSI